MWAGVLGPAAAGDMVPNVMGTFLAHGPLHAPTCQPSPAQTPYLSAAPPLQQTSDYVPQLEAFVPLLCSNAKPRVTTARVLSMPASGGGSPASRGRTRHSRSVSA